MQLTKLASSMLQAPRHLLPYGGGMGYEYSKGWAETHRKEAQLQQQQGHISTMDIKMRLTYSRATNYLGVTYLLYLS